LIIALPTAYLSAISSSAKKGILLKGGAILDAIASSKSIAFDKTGTLTTGELEVVSLNTWGNLSREKALEIAASLERGAKHPIGEAIIRASVKENVEISQPEEIRLVPGYGVEGKVKGMQGFIGHYEWLLPKLDRSKQKQLKEVVAREKREGRSIALLEVGGEMALFTFEDRLRPAAKTLIQELHDNLGLKTYLLTGDHMESGKKVQEKLGIHKVYANLRPEDKLYHVSRLSEDGGLMMVGDGINDAPALARATVGIAMGKIGSGAALDAADAVLLKEDLLDINWLILKGQKTRTIVRQNLTIALSSIAIAAIPALLGFVPLWLAVVMHEGGTCLVGLNALRLLKK
jgi:heavy metal translocating P-type ATPase